MFPSPYSRSHLSNHQPTSESSMNISVISRWASTALARLTTCCCVPRDARVPQLQFVHVSMSLIYPFLGSVGWVSQSDTIIPTNCTSTPTPSVSSAPRVIRSHLACLSRIMMNQTAIFVLTGTNGPRIHTLVLVEIPRRLHWASPSLMAKEWLCSSFGACRANASPPSGERCIT